MTFNFASGPVPPNCDANNCKLEAEWLDIMNSETYCYKHVPIETLEDSKVEYVGTRLSDWEGYK